MASILVVDSDSTARSAVARELRGLGHDVSELRTAGSAFEVLRSDRPDLLLLEWKLADVPGIEVLANLRRNTDIMPTRVVMTSGRGQSSDVVDALQSGADDIVIKPYRMEELIARVDACLRRPAATQSAGTLRAGGICIDNLGHQVFVDGDNVNLAPREYRLLLFLLANRDRVFTRKQLLTHVWDRSSGVGARTVDVHVRRLRSLLEPYGYDRFLQTVRGSGYRFSPAA